MSDEGPERVSRQTETIYEEHLACVERGEAGDFDALCQLHPDCADSLRLLDREFNAFQVCGQKVHKLPEWWVAPPAHLNYFSNDSLCRLLAGTGFVVSRTEASFPMEMFLLFGENYVGDKELGRICHERRVAFEANLRRNGYEESLRDFYQALAQQNLGRQVTAYAIVE